MKKASDSLSILASDFQKGDVRALGKLISAAENQDSGLWEALEQLYPKAGKARILGITGPPGAGKSTLINLLVGELRRRKETVAVLAVDPVSPFTGGALLGDRIRLADYFNDPGVFIRSLSTRGKLGGLSAATRQVAHLADAFGFQNILIETVGVGQSEVDIRNLADATLLVLVPEWGDAVQALKSGILEIGDIFVVNKADREGADRVVNELKSMAEMSHKATLPVVKTAQDDPGSIAGLLQEIDHFFRTQPPLVLQRKQAHAALAFSELVEAFAQREVQAWVSSQQETHKNPYRSFAGFLKVHPAGTLFKP